jgi:hypothetical protein
MLLSAEFGSKLNSMVMSTILGVLKVFCTTFVSGSQRLRIPPVMPSTPKIVNWIPKEHFS